MAANVDKFLTTEEHGDIDHTGITGVISTPLVQAQNNGGGVEGPRASINFIPTGGTAVSVVDNPGDNRIDVTIDTPTLTVNATIGGAATLSAAEHQYAGVDSFGGAFTLGLPATPNPGDRVLVKDETGSCATENVTLDGNGNNIDGSPSFSLTFNYQSLMLVFANGEWRIF